MANRYYGNTLNSPIRETQIKTMVKYCLTPVSMVIRKAGNNQKSFLQDVGEKKTLVY